MKISDLFRSTLENTRKEARELNNRLHVLRNERSSVEAMSPTKEEVLQDLDNWLNQSRAAWLTSMRARLAKVATASAHVKTVIGMSQDGRTPAFQSEDVFILLGELMKTAARDAIQDMEWPKSISSVKRTSELARLDREITAASARLNEIYSEANELGINL